MIHSPSITWLGHTLCSPIPKWYDHQTRDVMWIDPVTVCALRYGSRISVILLWCVIHTACIAKSLTSYSDMSKMLHAQQHCYLSAKAYNEIDNNYANNELRYYVEIMYWWCMFCCCCCHKSFWFSSFFIIFNVWYYVFIVAICFRFRSIVNCVRKHGIQLIVRSIQIHVDNSGNFVCLAQYHIKTICNIFEED